VQPLSAEQIVGSWAPLMLPINDDQSIDYPRLADQLDYLCAVNLSGVYSNGTSGEFYCQSEDEFDRISEMLADKCEAAGVAFQIGASHMSPTVCLARARRAAELRPGAIQVTLPDWAPCTDEEAIAFLNTVAKQTEVQRCRIPFF